MNNISCMHEINIDDHFRDLTKMIEIGKDGQREIRSKGDTALFGGHTTEVMKLRL